ncbi:uncharacterized protein [Sylvia atricapilla]|uniref:uncharacterized protein n=1 Tax=Sylvia atricapilla TaxID=48155 RepID=UPI003399A541
MMKPRRAEHQAKPPVSPGQQDEPLTPCPSSSAEDEEGVYGFLCPRSSVCSPEDEPGYELIHDKSLLSLWGSFPRRPRRQRSRFISLPQGPAGHSGDATGHNKFFSSREALAFDEHSQTKPGHMLRHNETDQMGLLRTDLGRAHNALDCKEDEVNAFSVSPGEVKTCSGRLVSVPPGGSGCLFPVPHSLLPRDAQLVLRLGCSGRHG